MASPSDALPAEEQLLGCGDNSCMFRRPQGMGTNGGCRCLKEIRPGGERLRVTRWVQLYQRALKQIVDRGDHCSELADQALEGRYERS